MLKIQLRILILSLLSSLLVLNSVNTNAAGRIAVKGHNGAVASSSAIASEIGIQIFQIWTGPIFDPILVEVVHKYYSKRLYIINYNSYGKKF